MPVRRPQNTKQNQITEKNLKTETGDRDRVRQGEIEQPKKQNKIVN